MNWIGVDVGKCIARSARSRRLARSGARIPTRAERLKATFQTRPQARVLLESCTESEWVARILEGLGCEVVVADPNYAPMYSHRSRRIKTDRRDARALAEACRVGAYRAAHRTS